MTNENRCVMCNDEFWLYRSEQEIDDYNIKNYCDECYKKSTHCVDCGQSLTKWDVMHKQGQQICGGCESNRNPCVKCHQPTDPWQRETRHEGIVCRTCDILDNLGLRVVEGKYPYDSATLTYLLKKRQVKTNKRIRTNCMFCNKMIDTPVYFRIGSYYKMHPNCMEYYWVIYIQAMKKMPEIIYEEANRVAIPAQIS